MTRVIWTSVVLVVSVPTSRASIDEAIVNEVFTTQTHQLLSVKTIDIPYSEKIEYSDHLQSFGVDYASHGDRFSINRFRMKGEKFRIERSLDGSVRKPDEIGPRIYAFDLKNHQLYDKRRMNLTVPKLGFAAMDKENIPYKNTYKWVFLNQSNYSFAGFQAKSAWAALRARLTNLQSAKLQDHHCVLMEFHWPETNRYSRIYFAHDLEYFPIKVEVFRAGARVVDHVVTKAQKVQTAEGNVIVPIKTVENQWEAEFGNPLFTITHTINEVGLSVNKDIPDHVFTIPLHMVRSYTNMRDIPASFNVDHVIDPTFRDPRHPPTSLKPREYNHLQIGDPALLEPGDHNDYREPQSVLVGHPGSPAVRSNALMGKISAILLFAFAVLAGTLLLGFNRRARRTP